MFGAAAANRVCVDANLETMHAARDYAGRQNKKTPLPSYIGPKIPAPKTKSLSLIHPIIALHDQNKCWYWMHPSRIFQVDADPPHLRYATCYATVAYSISHPNKAGSSLCDMNPFLSIGSRRPLWLAIDDFFSKLFLESLRNLFTPCFRCPFEAAVRSIKRMQSCLRWVEPDHVFRESLSRHKICFWLIGTVVYS